ncbi:MAG TPA: hypothetical protein P5550_10475 [Bacteroidales bacterium]|nr:hypothetical protein [Bacteroidales bacterium]HRZ77176.1 hypothetical protein [Bacteroidales bacterium]
MNETTTSRPGLMSWIARVVGLAAILWFLVFFIGQGYSYLKDVLRIEANSVSFMIFSTVIGYVVAWFSDLVGGIILTVGGGMLAIYLMFLGGSYGLQGGLIYGLPFLVPGILFLIAAQRASRT